MSTRRIATSLAAACLTVVVAGCSSSGSSPTTASTTPSRTPRPLSASGYRGTLHQVAQEENAAQHRIQHAFHARTVTQVRAALVAFATDQRHVSHQLAAVTPPSDAVAANTQLARAFNDNATALGSVMRKLTAAKTAKQALAIVQSDRSAQRVGSEIDAALAKLKKLGYTSGS